MFNLYPPSSFDDDSSFFFCSVLNLYPKYGGAQLYYSDIKNNTQFVSTPYFDADHSFVLLNLYPKYGGAHGYYSDIKSNTQFVSESALVFR